MYIFGGRSEYNQELGDLVAFQISTKRWYGLRNIGPSPSPRSAHRMTVIGKEIVVLGGGPTRDKDELSLAYVLDTTKIHI